MGGAAAAPAALSAGVAMLKCSGRAGPGVIGAGRGHWPGIWPKGLSVYGLLLTVVTLCHGLYACGSAGVGGICQEPVGAAETGTVEAADSAGVGAAAVAAAAGLGV